MYAKGIAAENLMKKDVVLFSSGYIASVRSIVRRRTGLRPWMKVTFADGEMYEPASPETMVFLVHRPRPKDSSKGAMLYAVYEQACRVAVLRGRLVPDLKPVLLLDLRDAIDDCLLDLSRPRTSRKTKKPRNREEVRRSRSLVG